MKTEYRKFKLRHALMLGGAVLGAAMPSPAFAQQEAPAPGEAAPKEGAESAAFNDITVVARRREERLQQVPVAVTAISGDDLSRQSITTLSDLTTKVPSIQIMPTAFGANIPRFVIRAQSQFEALFAQDPSVAVYFADVVQARAHGVNGTMYDLASVQVLKGPQGTLFGRNSTGGAVLIVPNSPTDQFEGYGSVEAGTYNLRSLEGAVNIPLSDDLQIRLSGKSYAHSGYTRGINNGVRFDDANNWSLRLGIKARLGDSITNTMFINNFKARENGTAFKLFNARPTLAANTLGVLALAEFAASKNEGFHTVRTATPADSASVSTFGIENTTVFELTDNVSIKNIFGYRKIRSNVPFEFDGTSQVMYEGRFRTKGKQYSDELQLVGDFFDGALSLIGGGYIFKESGLEIQKTILDYRPVFIQDAFGEAHVENKSQSVFAQGTFRIPGLDGLSLTAGARYTWDQRWLERISFNGTRCALLSADVGGVPLNPCIKAGDYSHKEPTYTLGADWQIDSDRLLYFATRKGYRAGGINQRANLPAQFVPYQPELVTDYELGFKADWHLGTLGSLRTNISAFYQDYSDIQRTQSQTVGVAPNTVLITRVVNAAKARVKGVEADVTWSPTRAITLRGYYSLADAKYKQWLVPLVGGGVQDRKHFPFANVPKHSGGGTATFTHDLEGSAGELLIQADVYAQSKVQLSDDNLVPEGINPGYAIVNARLEWNKVMGSQVNLAAWVRNLAEKKYYTSGTGVASAGLGFTVKTIGAPRTFGVSARVDF